MIRTVIEIKKNISDERLEDMKKQAEKEFNNHAGVIENSSIEKYKLVFEGNDELYSCIGMGMVNLSKIKGFVDDVASWIWEDDDVPEEREDVLSDIFKKYEKLQA